MLDSNIDHQDLINEINDIKENYHLFILRDLGIVWNSIEVIVALFSEKKHKEFQSTVWLLNELYKQLKSELNYYFTNKENDIFNDILNISLNWIEWFSRTSGIHHMINNSYDDFHIYIVDISKMLTKLDKALFDNLIFKDLDKLRKDIDLLLKKDNGVLDRLFRIMINQKQQWKK